MNKLHLGPSWFGFDSDITWFVCLPEFVLLNLPIEVCLPGKEMSASIYIFKMFLPPGNRGRSEISNWQ